jgi:hypothetical protein
MQSMMMEQCPICYSELEVRDCAPCHDCGWLEDEIDHFHKEIHTYTTYEIYEGLKLTLCNFCAADFGSYKSEYLGLAGNKRINLFDFNFIRTIERPAIEKDKFCAECGKRLKFLVFLRDLREKINAH